MESYLPALIILASMFLPSMAGVGAFFLYRKWQDRAGRKDPIANKRVYGAGEQLRARIEDETDSMMGGLMVLFFVGPLFLAGWAMQQIDWTSVRLGWNEGFWFLAFLLMAGWAIHRIVKHGGRRRRGLAGLKAEMFTAQELNRLIGDGCTVLHDVHAEGFNLDHVVIGPHAVFVVETKSVRKPTSSAAQDHFKVVYDGECLRFPDFVSRKAIQQTQRQAQWLAAYLKQATNTTVPVIATVALPGWWIESTGNARSQVRVFNPAGRGASFMSDERNGRTLDAGAAALIAQALVMRYPVAVG